MSQTTHPPQAVPLPSQGKASVSRAFRQQTYVQLVTVTTLDSRGRLSLQSKKMTDGCTAFPVIFLGSPRASTPTVSLFSLLSSLFSFLFPLSTANYSLFNIHYSLFITFSLSSRRTRGRRLRSCCRRTRSSACQPGRRADTAAQRNVRGSCEDTYSP